MAHKFARRPLAALWLAVLFVVLIDAAPVHAWHGGHGGGMHGGGMMYGHHPCGGPLVGVGFGVGGFGAFAPGLFMMPTFIPVPLAYPPIIVPAGMHGPMLPPPPPGFAPRATPTVRNLVLKRADPARAAQLTTIGDRLFRVANLKRAEERYQQAIRANPDAAAPRVHLAQVAMTRGRYDLAAEYLRRAELAEPGWILKAADIQTLYSEPTDFARELAKLETHLQINPGDRNAWLVLGAEWFLSGRTAKAADVFARLADPNRRPDIALEAFLEATNQKTPRGVQQ